MMEIFNDLIKEKMYKYEHESGLNVFVMPKKGFIKQYAMFATHYGSNDREFIIPGESEPTHVPDGIAHFLEHKMFEEESGSIFEEFSKNGASANAYTNFTTTAYLFSCTDNFYDNLRLLLDFVQRPYFTDENVEKEKGIIAQEIRMYDDDPSWRLFFNMLGGLYHVHPVKIDIAGTIESISKIDKDILYKCYNTFYHPSNMVLFAVGDVDVDKVAEIVNDNVKSKKRDGHIKRIYPNEPSKINKNYVEQKMSVSMPLFNIGFKDNDIGYGGKRLLKKDITTQICLEILAGRSSDLYEELYNDGLIDTTFDVEYVGEVDHGYSIIGGQSIDPEAVKKALIAKISSIYKIDDADFYRIRRKLLGRFIKSFNSVESIAHNFISYYMKDINILDFTSVIEDITPDDVLDRFKTYFNEDNCVLSIVKP
ncbi:MULTISPECIES: EF-P 5-aminopentanol modification-associated protein YfmH [Thermoanaerobacterium]|uniref:Peptidase M16 domain-containing protein n=2 Tax=Thermoanaerobacterium TaxID=28895 RepID=W9EBR0_9THEO|nr:MULTISPECIES: pitrilysin family protein [Thermoanaerobacterium]AFK86566.1 peptidase M16 domain protein [Thermoanaerobacterium saccharolyticum JW/SL-YS485]ETO38420.1 peptidase M16 domain-containing protein [Thermoanaerobacterium aotearoense SCUT27]